MLPITFNDELQAVALFNMVVVDDTFNDELHETTLLNLVNPLYDDIHVVALSKRVEPDTFNELSILILLSFIIILEIPLTLKFKFPVPLEFRLNASLGTKESYDGIKFCPYIYCCEYISNIIMIY